MVLFLTPEKAKSGTENNSPAYMNISSNCMDVLSYHHCYRRSFKLGGFDQGWRSNVSTLFCDFLETLGFQQVITQSCGFHDFRGFQ